SSVVDSRCDSRLGPDKQQYLCELGRPDGSKRRGICYRGHLGPVFGVRNFVRRHTHNARLEDMDGVASVGLDGQLIFWRLLDDCTSPPPKTYVKGGRNLKVTDIKTKVFSDNKKMFTYMYSQAL